MGAQSIPKQNIATTSAIAIIPVQPDTARSDAATLRQDSGQVPRVISMFTPKLVPLPPVRLEIRHRNEQPRSMSRARPEDIPSRVI
jgi:hypothetical protein